MEITDDMTHQERKGTINLRKEKKKIVKKALEEQKLDAEKIHVSPGPQELEKIEKSYETVIKSTQKSPKKKKEEFDFMDQRVEEIVKDVNLRNDLRYNIATPSKKKEKKEKASKETPSFIDPDTMHSVIERDTTKGHNLATSTWWEKKKGEGKHHPKVFPGAENSGKSD